MLQREWLLTQLPVRSQHGAPHAVVVAAGFLLLLTATYEVLWCKVTNTATHQVHANLGVPTVIVQVTSLQASSPHTHTYLAAHGATPTSKNQAQAWPAYVESIACASSVFLNNGQRHNFSLRVVHTTRPHSYSQHQHHSGGLHTEFAAVFTSSLT